MPRTGKCLRKLRGWIAWSQWCRFPPRCSLVAGALWNHDMTDKRRQDRLTLAGVRLQPRIGVTPGERRFPQACTADVTIWGDFEAAAATDELADACDYGRILDMVLEVAHGREYNLLESLAYRTARSILQAFPVARVAVKMRKQPAGMLDTIDHVEVEVEQE